MRLAIIAFTIQGTVLCRLLHKRFQELGYVCQGYVLDKHMDFLHKQAGLLPVRTSVGIWAGEQFRTRDGIVFIGAAGIAVRAIAPYVRDKVSDPAVIVMDEMGRFSVSLLSGHLGGANDLAEQAARIAGSVPVITTATDINHRFAVDLFSKKRSLIITDMAEAKGVSADILDGSPVGYFSDFPVEGEIPEGLFRDKRCKRNLWITIKSDSGCNASGGSVLRLIPGIVTLGIGCRKGCTEADISKRVFEVMEQANISMESVECIASIDLKAEEPGLVGFAGKMGVDFQVYPADELLRVPGVFSDSSFVEGITGVGNVCERAALRHCMETGEGYLLMRKQAGSGVTVAAAVRRWNVIH